MTRRYAAFLFDMDGTLINSIPSAIRAWTAWAERHRIDVDALMRVMHGVKAIETIRRFAPPGVDPQREFEALLQAEIDDVADVVEIAGAAAFTAALPPARWAIVTSAPRSLAEVRLRAAGLTPPRVMITADDVAHGKPAPDCFLLAAERLGVAARDCLVWEDAPAGIAAAEAAGADVMVVSTTHDHPLVTPWPSIAGYQALSTTLDGEGRLVLAGVPQRSDAVAAAGDRGGEGASPTIDGVRAPRVS